MRVSVLLLCVLVCLALLDAAQAKKKKNKAAPADGPCRVKNCDVCKSSKKKCKTCAPGFKIKQRGKKCKDKCPFDNCDECDKKGKKCVSCSAGYQLAGKQCELLPDPCSPNPCQNGGLCDAGACSCAAGFLGDNCQTADPCVPDPCQNGGSCSDGSCTCADGYEGDQCQTATDPCNPNPCQNGGTCSEGICACTTSSTSAFSGSHCETEVAFNWVVEVLDYSSEYGGSTSNWAATKVIGEPDVYPNYGDLANSWAQSASGSGPGFIEVRVANPLVVAGIQIYETNAGGGVTKIALKQSDGSWYTVWEGVQEGRPFRTSRIWQPTLEQTSFTTDSVRLETDCTGFGTWCEIDAINILGNAD